MRRGVTVEQGARAELFASPKHHNAKVHTDSIPTSAPTAKRRLAAIRHGGANDAICRIYNAISTT
ncbi:hypothetical protein SAMN05444161_2620 [Rhizobiales bacterium GAS191]|nr:hypothetical protein SAMN05519103_01731 [Rhizobiales bacterium GAS113]SED14899.1 hypothetical protein SAMN05444161_2620 [Rhizobiales bacterium GAS191]